MVSIQNYSAISPNVAFKARADKDSTPSNIPQSHAGLKTGAVLTAIEAPIGLAMTLGVTKLNKFNQDFANIARSMKYTLPVFIAIALGCGALVDKLNNDKRAKFAEELAEKSKKAILEDNDNAEETRAGNVYCKSGEGKKWGALLGIAGLVGENIISMLLTNVKGHKQTGFEKATKIMSVVYSVIAGAIGGLALGAIADSFSNKTAAKHADKLARNGEEQKADKPEDAKKSEEVKESDKDKKAE